MNYLNNPLEKMKKVLKMKKKNPKRKIYNTNININNNNNLLEKKINFLDNFNNKEKKENNQINDNKNKIENIENTNDNNKVLLDINLTKENKEEDNSEIIENIKINKNNDDNNNKEIINLKKTKSIEEKINHFNTLISKQSLENQRLEKENLLKKLKTKKNFSFDDLKSKVIHITYKKKGLEIGGPSNKTGQLVYYNEIILDNIVTDKDYVHDKYDSKYFYQNTFIGDNTNLKDILDKTYDFIFSSNCLEHILNPIKAFKESLRVLKDDGYLIIVVPDKKYTYDHFRPYSIYEELIMLYEKDVKEDDLLKIEQVLKYHDLSRDRLHYNKFLIFKEKCLNNFKTRIIHQHIYNFDLLFKISDYLNCEYVCHCQKDVNLWFVIKKRKIE